MNTGLATLIDTYGGGTGNLMLYYDLLNTGVVTGAAVVKNTAPAATVGEYTGYLETSKSIDTFIIGDNEGGDLSYSSVGFGPFENGFLGNADLESNSTFLFSFTKTDSEDGILFGSLVRDTFDNNGVTTAYGRGFNIGINDRNKLFLQGIDPHEGEYVITASELELATKNICSVSISPYSVSFGYYNLSADKVYSQLVNTNFKIENNEASESYFLGDSPTFYKDATFNGYIDEFAILSGNYNVSSLKSIASGFVSNETLNSGASQTQTIVDGYTNHILQETGVTGYSAAITGYKSVYTTGEFIQTVEAVVSSSVNEGDRFDTGFTLANGEYYLEEIGFIVKDDLYATTGDMAHATKGLKDVSVTVDEYQSYITLVAKETGTYPLYEVTPLYGAIGATGINRSPITSEVSIDGDVTKGFVLADGVIEAYRHDYLYFLSRRP